MEQQQKEPAVTRSGYFDELSKIEAIRREAQRQRFREAENAKNSKIVKKIVNVKQEPAAKPYTRKFPPHSAWTK